MTDISQPPKCGARRTASVLAICSALALAGCDTSTMDFDMRDAFGGPFSTAGAVGAPAAPRPEPDERGVISYADYQVVLSRQGDTANTIAARLGVDPGALARFNGLNPETVLREGEVLALPTRVAEPVGTTDIAALASGAIERAELPEGTSSVDTPLVRAVPSAELSGPTPMQHKVQRGETAYSIARLYDISVRALADWNGLGPDLAVREGQVLLVPLTTAAAAPAAAPEQPAPGQGSVAPVPPSASTPLPEPEPVAAVPDAPDMGQFQTEASDSASFAFPVAGRIIRDYDKGRNDGIGIAADPGTPVVAAGDGEVAAITRDTDQVPILVLRHPDNLLTVYANVGDIAVEKGDTVRRGQQVATVATGDPSFLHFEIREGIESVDPVPYLN
ncbi:peptidoglycan DD-metalloendopeptidase family protein [Dinoroseobacter sp. PD6]|uniref:LysM peptidoglycan-binding domain-containing protein n=1 Tax=Dinoroseobacter sp. PD6 TaxID=3028384 RepID=UPI00237C082F|nr:LysM peptidoglycan-binding domain-containing protein [Dinoroseobacter sp. PD6]MDD9716611.1 peptidoglycan DD-metalloendopeptidase family protein [Dinoroseobacter sp. PD6]